MRKLSAAGERVAHEIDRPDCVWQRGHIERHPFALGQAPLGGTAQIELHGLVHAIDPFGIPVRSLLAKVVAAFPDTAAGMRLYELRQRGDQLGIAHRPILRRRIPRRSRQADACTGPAQRPRVDLEEEPRGLALARRP